MKSELRSAGVSDGQSWDHHVHARQQSGLSRAAYCRANNLVVHHLRDRERRARKQAVGSRGVGLKATKTSPFVKVKSVATVQKSFVGSVRLTLPTGLFIDFGDSADLSAVAKFVAEMGNGR